MGGSSNLEVVDDLSVEDLQWVLGEYGYGSSLDVPVESTIFAAFQQQDEEVQNAQHALTNGSSSTDGQPCETTNSTQVNMYDQSQSQSRSQSQSQPQQQQFQQQLHQMPEQQWLPTPTLQDNVVFSDWDYSSIANLPSFTIDPMNIMAPNGLAEGDEPSRPSSAPGFNGAVGDGFSGMLGVPNPGSMMRRWVAGHLRGVAC
jgi:hypothetical protein